jgi:hypothetical protein
MMAQRLLNARCMDKTPCFRAIVFSIFVGACATSPSGGGPGPGSSDSCTPLIGSWVATLASGTTVTAFGATIPISGTINFMLVHDDADLPDIVDFSGTANIVYSGQTISQAFMPANAGTADAKDSKCDGGLQLLGQASTPVGLIDFGVTATLDTKTTPMTGSGQFTMKTDADSGSSVHGMGNLTLAKQ